MTNGMTHLTQTPLVPEVGVLALPYHHFDARWLTPHHVLTRLAGYFNVVWLEPAHHWRETRSLDSRRDRLAALSTSLPASFRIMAPTFWSPDLYRPARLRRALAYARVRRGWRALRQQGARSLVLHLWHHQFESALDVGAHDVSLYHIDDEYSFSAVPTPMPASERRVIGDVDEVFAISPALLERKGGINPRMTFAPEGVDYRLYSTPVAEPLDLRSIPRPRIGYCGMLKSQLNWPLLRALATRHREWQFVFVGPRSADAECVAVMDEMARFDNVHFLGAKTVRDLAAYPQHFDVCIMPYALTAYTENVYPLKLHEYLASGRPVVGSPIRSLKDFEGVISLAATADEWSAALARALQPANMDAEAVAARQRTAQRNDWGALVYDIARSICGHLDETYVARLRPLEYETPVLA